MYVGLVICLNVVFLLTKKKKEPIYISFQLYGLILVTSKRKLLSAILQACLWLVCFLFVY